MIKTRKHIAFFAASLNIVASAFFADATIQRYADPNNVSSALGMWFASISILL